MVEIFPLAREVVAAGQLGEHAGDGGGGGVGVAPEQGGDERAGVGFGARGRRSPPLKTEAHTPFTSRLGMRSEAMASGPM